LSGVASTATDIPSSVEREDHLPFLSHSLDTDVAVVPPSIASFKILGSNVAFFLSFS